MKQIRFNQYGVENEPHLLFIHGAFLSSRMWEKQVKYFKKYFCVITYDLRAHGVNRGISENLSFEQYSDDLKQIIDQLGGREKPIICGLSLGGMVAQHFAVRYPDYYKALILCDTSVSMSLTLWDKMMHILFPRWIIVNLVRFYTIESYVKQSFLIARLTRGRKWLGNRETVAYEREEMLQMNKDDWMKVFNLLYTFRKQKLTKIQKPTLIVLGQYEPKSIFKHAEIFKKELSDVKIEVIENAGHVPNLDQPAKFNDVVHNFVNSRNPVK